MKSLDTLLKLRKHELDEKSRELQRINARINELEDIIKQAGDEMQKEIKLTKDNPDYSLAWRGYFDSIKAKQVLLRQKIKNMEHSHRVAQDEVRQAFQKSKSIEILQTTQQEKTESDAINKELKELEDLIIQKRK